MGGRAVERASSWVVELFPAALSYVLFTLSFRICRRRSTRAGERWRESEKGRGRPNATRVELELRTPQKVPVSPRSKRQLFLSNMCTQHAKKNCMLGLKRKPRPTEPSRQRKLTLLSSLFPSTTSSHPPRDVRELSLLLLSAPGPYFDTETSPSLQESSFSRRVKLIRPPSPSCSFLPSS